VWRSDGEGAVVVAVLSRWYGWVVVLYEVVGGRGLHAAPGRSCQMTLQKVWARGRRARRPHLSLGPRQNAITPTRKIPSRPLNLAAFVDISLNSSYREARTMPILLYTNSLHCKINNLWISAFNTATTMNMRHHKATKPRHTESCTNASKSPTRVFSSVISRWLFTPSVL
jgi:hypothetical protein